MPLNNKKYVLVSYLNIGRVYSGYTRSSCHVTCSTYLKAIKDNFIVDFDL